MCRFRDRTCRVAVIRSDGRVRVEAMCPGFSDPAGDGLYIFVESWGPWVRPSLVNCGETYSFQLTEKVSLN